MEVGGVIRAFANRVNGRVDKTNAGSAGVRRLLIHQGGESGPQRRGTTGAFSVLLLVGVSNDENIFGRQRHVRQVAHGRRTMIGRHVDALLPAGDGVSGTDAAAAPPITAIGIWGSIIPNRLGNVGASGIGRCCQHRSAHFRDIGAVGWKRDGTGEGIHVTGGVKKRLPLCRHSLENPVGSWIGDPPLHEQLI